MTYNSTSIFIKCFTLCIVLLISFSANTQTLSERLEGKTNFKEIQTIAETYYAELKENGLERNPSDPKYKHWKRWEWYQNYRLDPNGNVLQNNNHVLAAERAVKKMEANGSRSTNSDWTFLGPDSHIPSPTRTTGIGLGRVDRIAFHPTDPDIIFLGTPKGGLWKTTDGGNTWSPMDDFLPNMGISGICISHSNPNLIYILTGAGDDGALPGGNNLSSGVLKSTDGGTTWEQTGPLSPSAYFAFNLEIHPDNDQILFAATEKGLWKTSNGGTTWNLAEGGWFYDVKFKPGDPSTVYASGPSSLKYNTNTGDGPWPMSSLTPTPTITNGRTAIAVTADDPNRVYLHMGPNIDSTTFNGFYYSNNSGQSFLRVANSPDLIQGQPFYNFCVAASPISKNVVVTGALICHRSTNSGVGWSPITTYFDGSNLPGYVHPDIHALKYNPLNNYLYVAGDGGFHRSMDNGTTWTNLSDGIEIATYYKFAETPLDPNYILGGNQDNGVKLRKSNSTAFDHIDGADGYDVAFSPTDKSKFYCSRNSFVDKYWNNGANKEGITPRLHWFSQVAVHEANDNILFVGTKWEGGRLYKSINAGSTWDTLFVSAGDAIVTCPSLHNRLYLASEQTIYRSDDLGDSAIPLHSNSGFPSGSLKVTDLAVNPINSGFVYATIGGTIEGVKVLQSSVAGNSWTDISGSLPNVATICIATTASGDLYVGTEIGVFFKAAGAADWVPFRNGLPATIVADLSINESQNTIRAATFGRGIWESPLSNGDCTTNLTWSPSPDLEGYHYYEASNSITNQSVILGGMTTEVFMKSGNYIDLKDGFQAKSDGLYFRAYLGPCSTGGIPELKPQKEENSVKKEKKDE